jgi:hypothetical protein
MRPTKEALSTLVRDMILICDMIVSLATDESSMEE